MSSRTLKYLAVAALTGIAGCASSAPVGLPTIATGADAEVTVDGLHKMDNTVMQLAYAKADMDLTQYTAFMLDPATVAYKRDPQGRRRGTVSDANFELTPEQMESLKEVFHEQVVEALTEDDGYELVTVPAENVLRISASMLDLIVRVPTERTGGRSRTYAASYGEVTLILELYDSLSGEILARAGERMDPTRSSRDLAEVSRAFVRADVTRMFQHWADILRERLDLIRGVETPS